MSLLRNYANAGFAPDPHKFYLIFRSYKNMLKYFILGVLMEFPTSGYNLKKRFLKNLIRDFGFAGTEIELILSVGFNPVRLIAKTVSPICCSSQDQEPFGVHHS